VQSSAEILTKQAQKLLPSGYLISKWAGCREGVLLLFQQLLLGCAQTQIRVLRYAQGMESARASKEICSHAGQSPDVLSFPSAPCLILVPPYIPNLKKVLRYACIWVCPSPQVQLMCVPLCVLAWAGWPLTVLNLKFRRTFWSADGVSDGVEEPAPHVIRLGLRGLYSFQTTLPAPVSLRGIN